MLRCVLGLRFVLLLALLAPTALLAVEESGPWVVRAYFGSESMIREVAGWADHLGRYPEKDLILLQVDSHEWERLEAAGFYVQIDDARSALLRRGMEAAPRNPTGSGIPGFPCYRTVEETLTTGASLAAAHPQLATWIDIGDSWEKTADPGAGYDLMVLRLTNGAIVGPKPRLFVTSAIHAREYATAELTTRWAERLLADYGIDPDTTWLLDEHEIHLLLQANPDGRKRAETGISWRKNANNDYCANTDSRGADLNRNFSFQWGCCGGSSGSTCATTYRGPSAGSEPESQAIQTHILSLFPDQRSPELGSPAPSDATGVYIDVHSFGEVILSSWGFTTTPPPNGDAILRLGRKWGYLDGYRPQLGSQGTVDGATKDFSYGGLGVPGYTLELGTAFFESCTVFGNSILEGNLAALEYAAKVVRTPYLTPLGPDIVDASLPPMAVPAGTFVSIQASADDTRYSTANGVEPSQNIAAAELTVDIPPWGSSPSPLAMSPSDGVFDAPLEALEASLDTSSLAPGRHRLFLRAQDADTNWGAVSGLLLHVIDPAVAPTLEGTIRDAVSLQPLEATVTANGFVTTSDPATGDYTMQVPSDTYTLEATAPGYVPVSVEGVVAGDHDTLFEDFFLVPLVSYFSDDVESGDLGWSKQGSWAITTEASNSPTHSWTDSPGGPYGSNTNSSLTSPPVDLSSVANPVLSFYHRYDLESSFDFGRIEIQADGGSWVEIAAFTGTELNWTEVEIPVPSLGGSAAAHVRFRLTSDSSLQADGWHLDDFRVVAPASAPLPIFVDGFESGDLTGWTSAVPGTAKGPVSPSRGASPP